MAVIRTKKDPRTKEQKAADAEVSKLAEGGRFFKKKPGSSGKRGKPSQPAHLPRKTPGSKSA